MAQGSIFSSPNITVMDFHKLRALVIEDEKDVRMELVNALNETPDFEVVGESDSVESGYSLITSIPAEVIFLDIKLLGGDAFQLLRLLRQNKIHIPPVVINTGFRDFENAKRIHNDFKEVVIHILNKPFWEDWAYHQESILEALYLHRQSERLSKSNPVINKMIPIQDGRQSYLIDPKDIVHVTTGAKGQGRTEVILASHQFGCSLSLTQLLAQLPSQIIQINRFEAVNLQWVSIINHGEKILVLRNGDMCSVGNAFYPDICRMFGREND